MKRMTLKQAKWLELYMSYGNATQAALEAYHLNKETQYASAKQIGYENMTKLDIEINELMDKAGLSDVYLLKRLSENLEATKLFGKNAIECPDNSSRIRALEIALKLKGMFKEKDERIPQDHSTSDSTAQIVATVEKILALGDVTKSYTQSPSV